MKLKAWLFIGSILFPVSGVPGESVNKHYSSVGIGFQYAIAGVKFGLEGDINNYYGSVGPGAYAAGVERPVSPSGKITIGAVVGGFLIIPYGAVNINYHLNGYRNKGWVLGVDAGGFFNPFYHENTENDEAKRIYSLVFVNLGYKF
ncbi:MAG: hypothetical protein KDJ38_02975 [Gammaproteobacteria bacterium]|nr:hypothetical protein [Gammaproteobacteria bacterium]